jgi:hypothetical protein
MNHNLCYRNPFKKERTICTMPALKEKNYEESRKTLKITPLLGLYAIPAVHVCDLLLCVVEREREMITRSKP